MQGLPRQSRAPGEILGVEEHASLEVLRQAFVEARARALAGANLDDLPQADPGARSAVGDVEWAYKELVARFMTADDEDAAVSAMLLPGLTPDVINESAPRGNVIVFSTVRKETAPRTHQALEEEEDATVLAFHGLGGDPTSEEFVNIDLSDGIPELKEALARAAEPYQRLDALAAPARVAAGPGPAVAPKPTPPLEKPTVSALPVERLPPTHNAPFAPRPWLRQDNGFRAPPTRPAEVEPASLNPSAKTIRTVIGGEERAVVNVVARDALREEMQDTTRGIISSAETVNGKLLRLLRTTVGVDEKEICARVRMSVEQLVAIEEDDFDRLPAPVYYRGFVVSYLKYLGLERPDLADALTQNFRAQLRARYFRGR
jgi:hypothetical protein